MVGAVSHPLTTYPFLEDKITKDELSEVLEMLDATDLVSEITEDGIGADFYD